MLKAILIDDEQYCLDALEATINNECPEVKIIEMCLDGETGIEAIKTHNPELIFLDIAMPKMDGFEMLDILENIDFEVIFTTAYDNYAIQAFKVNAVDYLLKPIDSDELREAVDKVKQRVKSKKGTLHINEQIKALLISLRDQSPAFQQISIPTAEGMQLIEANRIMYCTGEGSYTNIHLDNNTDHLISKTLKYIEKKLKDYPFFIRIHNSSLINLNKLKSYVRSDGGYVIMHNNKTLSVSKQRRSTLLKKLN